MTKQIPRKVALAAVGILAFTMLIAGAWSVAAKDSATAPLERTATRELQPLVPAVSALIQGAKPKTSLECYETAHTYTRTHSFCQDAYRYTPTSSLPASSRAKVVAEATALDKALEQNDWRPDRPQDKVHTVAAAIPTTPLAASHGHQVPFHKNVGDISCNLVVAFGGPTDGTSPGVIEIDRFSCQQNISYFMLHVSNYTDKGFGG